MAIGSVQNTYSVGLSTVYLEKLCKKVTKLLKKVDRDPCIINLILRELQDQKEIWIADEDGSRLKDNIDDCSVCDLFSRLHKKIINELLEVGNDLVRENKLLFAAAAKPPG